MMVFCDTSALFAMLDQDSEQQGLASAGWKSLVLNDIPLLTTNYVLIELVALLQGRLGMDSVRVLQSNVLPSIQVEWISEATHQRALQALLTANRRHLSLVDCVSFDVMRENGVSTAFEFDQHFAEQGFRRYQGDD